MSLRIAVSNLAWEAADEPAILPALATAGAAGIEVAPTRIAPWEALTPARLGAFRSPLAGHGLAVSALQAVFYGVPGLQLVQDEAAFAAMAEHLRRVAEVAAALGTATAVFGAARQRRRGSLPRDEARLRAAERLHRLGAVAEAGGLTLAVEPIPARYGADFLEGWRECLDLVRAVAHRSVRLQLDTGCTRLAGDDIGEAVSAGAAELVHFHAAEPDLADFSAPVADHAGAARALARIGYGGWITIEVGALADDAEMRLAAAIAYARRTYLGAGGT